MTLVPASDGKFKGISSGRVRASTIEHARFRSTVSARHRAPVSYAPRPRSPPTTSFLQTYPAYVVPDHAMAVGVGAKATAPNVRAPFWHSARRFLLTSGRCPTLDLIGRRYAGIVKASAFSGLPETEEFSTITRWQIILPHTGVLFPHFLAGLADLFFVFYVGATARPPPFSCHAWRLFQWNGHAPTPSVDIVLAPHPPA